MAELASPDLDFLPHQQRAILDELRAVREDYRALITTLPKMLERIRRQDSRFDEIERRIGLLNDDLVTNVKIEIGGAFARMETRIEQAMDNKLDVLKAELLAASGK
jgi:hypothetical protein